MKENYFVDERGFYGEFGGAYVPEILYKCVHDLICPSSSRQSLKKRITHS